MKTRIKVTYVAMQADDGRIPIMTASTFKDLEKGINDYYGVDKEYAKCLGFTPYYTKYPDEYEGYFTYKCSDDSVDHIRVYCIEYYPRTVYEVNE